MLILAQALGQRLEPIPAPRDQDQIVTIAREALSESRPDPG